MIENFYYPQPRCHDDGFIQFCKPPCSDIFKQNPASPNSTALQYQQTKETFFKENNIQNVFPVQLFQSNSPINYLMPLSTKTIISSTRTEKRARATVCVMALLAPSTCTVGASKTGAPSAPVNCHQFQLFQYDFLSSWSNQTMQRESS